MKDANTRAFEFLIDQLTKNSNFSVKKGTRYIKTKDFEKERVL